MLPLQMYTCHIAYLNPNLIILMLLCVTTVMEQPQLHKVKTGKAVGLYNLVKNSGFWLDMNIIPQCRSNSEKLNKRGLCLHQRMSGLCNDFHFFFIATEECKCSCNDVMLAAIIGVLVLIIIVLIIYIVWLRKKGKILLVLFRGFIVLLLFLMS